MIKVRCFYLVLLLIFSFNGNASNGKRSRVILTDSARVSLITCSPGSELYSIFGHSAIRVADPLKKIDIVFNYGTFNFADPDFYPNFVKGRLNYILSVYPYKDFEQDYITEKRWIYEQKLNINTSEKQYLLDSLLINYRPENRYYLYDFLYDNCATRIRNIFVEAIHRNITFDYSSFEKRLSFRQLLMPYLTQKPWAKLGINLLLGLPLDKKATPWDYMFLPDHLHAAFQHASFSTDSTIHPVVQQARVLLKGKRISYRINWFSPLLVFLIVLVFTVLITYRDIKKGIKNLWLDRLLLVIFGLLGVLFTFLWVGTSHRSMVWNFNLLWANPFHLMVVFFVSIKKPRQWVKTYLSVNLIILLALLITWPFLPQALPWAIYPLALALALRMFVMAK